MKLTKKLNKNGKFEFRNPRIYVLCGIEFADENTVLFERRLSDVENRRLCKSYLC